MTWVGWRIVERLSLMLKPDERDAVLGDHEELGMSPARSALDIAGLVARRSVRPAAKALRVVLTAVAYAILILCLGNWFGIHVATAE